ncbi:MAG: 4Fe-4S binding protein [Bacteroidales bacterium]|nr:4Fe-4S binding protein [Bacteroidales bacterium]
MEPLISISSDKCKVCYACVRSCPVKAIKVISPDKSPIIDSKRCISCGSCVRVCKFEAISYLQQWEQVRYLLINNKPIVAILDPSYVSEFSDFPDFRKLIGMLKFIGFKKVFDTSIAVELLAYHYHNLVDDFKGKHYIMSNCPVVVAYVERFVPSVLNNLAPLVTPMGAMVKLLKENLSNDYSFVYITPCIAAKEEVRLQGDSALINYVLTFEEIRKLFSAFQVTDKMIEYAEIDPPSGCLGYLYPVSNGIVQIAKISEALLDNKVITGEGENMMIGYLNDFEKYSDAIGCHFNLFYCKGCVSGPGTTNRQNHLLLRSIVIEHTKQLIKANPKALSESTIEKYLSIDLSRTFHDNYHIQPQPSEEKIREILLATGKKDVSEEVDCRACGFDSCRSFAIAVAQGITTTDMCITFSLQNQRNYTHALRVTNEKLARIQEALIESEKKMRMEQEIAREASEMLTAMFQKLRAGIVIFDQHLKIVRSNQSFVNILGDEAAQINDVVPGLVGADLRTLLPKEFIPLANYVLEHNEEILNKDIPSGDGFLNVSVFPIKKNKIAGAILRDPYQPDVRKEEIINRLDEVINRHLDMVQKIGYLLGEGAAETERMLNSIIQTFKTKEEK